MSVLKPTQSGARTVRKFQFASVVANDATDGALSSLVAGTESAPSPLTTSGKPTTTNDAAKTKSSGDERLALSRRIAELEEAAKQAAASTEAARQDGIEQGRKLGREEAEKQDAARLKALEDALISARAAMLDALTDKHELSVDIARAALARILGERSAYAGMISETAAHWNRKLASASVIKIRVSSEDFEDPATAESLTHQLGNVQIALDDTLKPGSCVFDLELGEVDASLPVQAANADLMLREHGSEAPLP